MTAQDGHLAGDEDVAGMEICEAANGKRFKLMPVTKRHATQRRCHGCNAFRAVPAASLTD